MKLHYAQTREPLFLQPVVLLPYEITPLSNGCRRHLLALDGFITI